MSEHTYGSTPFDHLGEFGSVDSYRLDELMRESERYDHLVDVFCVHCGVNVGFGHCFHCLKIALQVFRDEDSLDEL